jgi:uncharacterized membrane protein
MKSGFGVVLRLASMLLVSALAILGCVLVLGVFEDAEVHEALVKTVSVLGILAIASLAMVVIIHLGSRNDQSRGNDGPGQS